MTQAKQMPGEFAVAPAGRMSVRTVLWRLVVGVGFLAILLVGCLVLLGRFIKGAGWFGVTDYTYVYLVGSMVVAALEMLQSLLLLTKKQRPMRLASWLAGITCAWVPVSIAVAVDVLPSTLPVWLPCVYLGYVALLLAVLLIFYRDLLMIAIRGNDDPLMNRNEHSKWSVAIEGTFYAAWVSACCWVLVVETDGRAQTAAALAQMERTLDSADTLVRRFEENPLDAELPPIFAAHRGVLQSLSKLASAPISPPHAEALGRLASRTKEQQAKVKDRLDRATADLMEKRKKKAEGGQNQ